MKKNVILLLVLFIGVSCKKKESEMPQENPILAQETQQERKYSKKEIYQLAKFLREKEDSICPIIGTLQVLKTHNIDRNTFDKMLHTYWDEPNNVLDTTKLIYKEILWKDVKTKMKTGCYSSYIAITGDSLVKNNSDLILTQVDTFSLDVPCYSNAVFKEIEREHQPSNSTILKFTKARSNFGYTVIFRLNGKNMNVQNYDLTNWPTFIQK